MTRLSPDNPDDDDDSGSDDNEEWDNEVDNDDEDDNDIDENDDDDDKGSIQVQTWRTPEMEVLPGSPCKKVIHIDVEGDLVKYHTFPFFFCISSPYIHSC